MVPCHRAETRHTRGFHRHYAPMIASRLRCRYRFTSAKQAHSRSWFFFKPRYLTFSKPKMRFRIRNGCSTFARTLAFTRFFAFCNSSTKFLYLTLRLVISCACGAACRIASPCPRYAPSPHTLRSSPCSSSASMCLSATEAADVHTECTWPCLESTPICAFSPKYHCLPLRV